jgi:hypothetical protein
MLCVSCSSSHTEHNKIGFAFFRFFNELIWNLQVTGSNNKTGKNLLALSPLELLNLHKYALAFNTQAPRETPLPNSTLPRRSRLAGGEVGPGNANKQGGDRFDSQGTDSRRRLGRREVR